MQIESSKNIYNVNHDLYKDLPSSVNARGGETETAGIDFVFYQNPGPSWTLSILILTVNINEISQRTMKYDHCGKKNKYF